MNYDAKHGQGETSPFWWLGLYRGVCSQLYNRWLSSAAKGIESMNLMEVM